MVKRQKEKQYNSAREQKAYGISRSSGLSTASTGSVQRRLPFDCCALTLTAFQDPVCLRGSTIIFEHAALTQFLLQHSKDPVTGTPMTTRDIITLKMDKDEEGRWQCPVLTKPFADHTKIVAVLDTKIKTEAYVYSFEAYQELNVKAKNYVDLTTGHKFDPKKDVMILNDPTNEEFHKRRDINSFWHITHARAKESNTQTNVKHSVTATRILDQLQKDKQAKEKESKKRAAESVVDTSDGTKKLKILACDVTGIQHTTGKASGSFTSTSMAVESDNITREATAEEILDAQFQEMKRLKKKGYVQLHTSLGSLLLELHCDIVPRTCTNFLGLCEKNQYDNTKFHRLIPKFMIQGGKGDEDTSLWGPPFSDEFDDRLKHTGGGIVSMANAGPKTNKRQFFITFKSCPHLDRKHSIFGKLVTGMDIVKQMEEQPVDKKDRPLEPIMILKTEIFENPAKEAEEAVRQRIEERALARQQKEAHTKATALGRSVNDKNKSNGGTASSKPTEESKIVVGKYLKAVAQPKEISKDDDDEIPAVPVSRLKPPPAKTKFGDFSGW